MLLAVAIAAASLSLVIWAEDGGVCAAMSLTSLIKLAAIVGSCYLRRVRQIAAGLAVPQSIDYGLDVLEKR